MFFDIYGPRGSFENLAYELLKILAQFMKSARRRFQPHIAMREVLGSGHNRFGGSVRLAKMPAPTIIPQISPEQIVTDILVSTLQRVQRSSSPDVAAAAARFLSALR